MKKFNEFINRLSVVPRSFDHLEKQKWFHPFASNSEGGISFPAIPQSAAGGCPPGEDEERWRRLVQNLIAGGKEIRTESWVEAGLIAGGVKAYAPSAIELAAIERIDPHGCMEEYWQPFPTFSVVVPDDHDLGKLTAGEIGRPAAIVSRFDHDLRFLCTLVVGDTRKAIVTFMSVRDRKISDIAAEWLVDTVSWDCPGMTRSEVGVSQWAVAVVLSVCSLMSHFGTKRIGHANPAHAAKLLASVSNPKIPANIREANGRELRKIPEMYGFHQTVKLYEREDCDGTHRKTGAEVRPHWRRGHWAMQPCGPKQAERKRVFRPAVLVNGHRFGGKLSDTRVTLTTS